MKKNESKSSGTNRSWLDDEIERIAREFPAHPNRVEADPEYKDPGRVTWVITPDEWAKLDAE